MKPLAAALVCLLALPACRKAEPPAIQLENDNLLTLVNGTTVVERSDEHGYETSVAQALDAMSMTPWMSAPGGKQTAVFALAAPTRLRSLGATVVNNRGNAPAGLRFETSLDGTTWRNAVEAKLKFEGRAPQLFDLEPPVDARYLRVSAIEPAYQSQILSLYALGSETAPAVQGNIEGCWTINDDVPTRFVRSGARVIGTIGPMVVDGGTNGRVYRLMWLERAMWGYAAVSVSPDGQHLTGVRWHEEVNPFHSGDGWIGRRVPCPGSTTINTARIVNEIIRRSGRWRLYGVRFDEQDRIVAAESANTLDLAAKVIRDHPSHRFRIVASELRESSEEKNRARCTAKLSSIREALGARGTDLSRVELVVAGNEHDPLADEFTVLRVMESGVELQVVPSR